jgi:hypothetical protein
MSRRRRPQRSPGLKQALNPHVPLRAKTVPSKKKLASKQACRGRLDFSRDVC